MEETLTINVRGRLLDLSTPQVMGILNVTPDSFFEGSRAVDERAIAMRVGMMLTEGASIIDVGAVSTRPGAPEVSADEEMRRLDTALSVIRSNHPDLIVSLDTFRADVARRCIDTFGVDIINDVSGGADPDMFNIVSYARVPYIIMHGSEGLGAAVVPERARPTLVSDMLRFFAERIEFLHGLGVSDVIVDPGFGFGKTRQENYDVLRHLADFHVFGHPILVGLSRKSMIYQPLGLTPAQALNGTTVLNTLALAAGAHFLRVHDVRPAVEAVQLMKSLNP